MILKINEDLYLYCDTFHPNKDRMYVHEVTESFANQEHVVSVLEDNKPLIINLDSDGEFIGGFCTPPGNRTTWINFKIGDINTIENYMILVDVRRTLAAEWRIQHVQDISAIMGVDLTSKIINPT